MSDRFLIACDPGKSGGIAWFAPGVGVQAVKMPETDEALLGQLRRIAAQYEGECTMEWKRPELHAYIEQVGGFIRKRTEDDEDGGAQPGSAMFRFGENAGLVRGILMGLGATVHLVPPRNWQKPLFLKKGQSSKGEWKNKLKAAAQRRFQGIKVTLNTADALLLLSYAAALNNVDAQVIQKGNVAPTPRRKGEVSPEPEKRATEAPARSTEPASGNFHVADWKGSAFVFKEHNGGVMLIRKATEEDKRTLPRK